MDNALYYTLSTIAQTLAGALAILVAVVLFKLAALAKERELSADIFDTYSVDADVYLPIARTQGYDAILAASQLAPTFLVVAVGLGVVCLLLYVWLIVAMVSRLAG